MDELQMLLSNIQSLLSEITQNLGIGAMQPSAQMAQPQPVEKPPEQQPPAPQQSQEQQQAPSMSPKKPEEEEMKKSMQQTESDGVTANDNAETRAEDNIDTTEENVKDVAKAAVEMIMKKLAENNAQIEVKKSETDLMAEMTSALTELAKSQKQIMEKQNTLETSVMNILKGFNIADEIESSMKIEKSEQETKGLNNPEDNEQLAKLLKSLVKEKNEDEDTTTAFERNNYVQKKLRDVNVLKGLTGFFNK